jgi:hypothetical protein
MTAYINLQVNFPFPDVKMLLAQNYMALTVKPGNNVDIPLSVNPVKFLIGREVVVQIKDLPGYMTIRNDYIYKSELLSRDDRLWEDLGNPGDRELSFRAPEKIDREALDQEIKYLADVLSKHPRDEGIFRGIIRKISKQGFEIELENGTTRIFDREDYPFKMTALLLAPSL